MNSGGSELDAPKSTVATSGLGNPDIKYLLLDRIQQRTPQTVNNPVKANFVNKHKTANAYLLKNVLRITFSVTRARSCDVHENALSAPSLPAHVSHGRLESVVDLSSKCCVKATDCTISRLPVTP
ncbi:hypothetical protein EVAR_30071_1 [Eumeta japonica]|uniref:Uncharacterized protein n=1 Tax=Eumeta variegata TaxID=151549 RepID=A0A4C1XA69_EUMVA|nr:hypothetical protein EVAR_30071_1 [Eumeta japonica]